ncbi:T9SS type A sorting domain-containing protein [Flavobacterium sp.]|uniref:T9SS type A sorting domain-containing protein n=1 Tax=Flavobacterium sp. TaxID=239 RepID=UPI00286E092F|nr:T9SS type A sorting domain-containing protein [Flavobacterium sp.]
MKKITILLFCFLSFLGFSQSKTTGVINLNANMTANFTLNNATSKVTLVLKGPSDRWFGLGLGISSGFNMSAGDALVYSTSLTDRNFVGFQAPINDTQDWTTMSNSIASGIRTLTLERNLTTSDGANDLQMPYASTSSIRLSWTRSNAASNSLSSNHLVGFATGTFTDVLSVQDFSLNASSIYPNPSSGEFYIKTKTNLSRVNVYNQTGGLVKTIIVAADSREVKVEVNGIQSGVYFLELQNDSEKSWKKVIFN